MTRYVVDASVIIQALVAQSHTAEATALVASIPQTNQIHIPEFCLLECANVLWKQVRFQKIPKVDAAQLLLDLLDLPLVSVPVLNLLPTALEIGLAHQLAVYDSLYIALALSLNCPLVTVDDRQLQAAIAQGSAIDPTTDFSEV